MTIGLGAVVAHVMLALFFCYRAVRAYRKSDYGSMSFYIGVVTGIFMLFVSAGITALLNLG